MLLEENQEAVTRLWTEDSSGVWQGFHTPGFRPVIVNDYFRNNALPVFHKLPGTWISNIAL